MAYNQPEEILMSIEAGTKPDNEQNNALNCPYCAQHLVPNEVHGHVSCFNCGQVLDACCGGTDF